MSTRESLSASEQAQKLPTATPTYVLRGHVSAIHALNFYHANSRLVSGDGDGWIVVWSLVTKRPVAAWKAHEGAILGVQAVDFRQAGRGGETRVFTYVFSRSFTSFHFIFFLSLYFIIIIIFGYLLLQYFFLQNSFL
jgi:hypothetical protein